MDKAVKLSNFNIIKKIFIYIILMFSFFFIDSINKNVKINAEVLDDTSPYVDEDSFYHVNNLGDEYKNIGQWFDVEVTIQETNISEIGYELLSSTPVWFEKYQQCQDKGLSQTNCLNNAKSKLGSAITRMKEAEYQLESQDSTSILKFTVCSENVADKTCSITIEDNQKYYLYLYVKNSEDKVLNFNENFKTFDEYKSGIYRFDAYLMVDSAEVDIIDENSTDSEFKKVKDDSMYKTIVVDQSGNEHLKNMSVGSKVFNQNYTVRKTVVIKDNISSFVDDYEVVLTGLSSVNSDNKYVKLVISESLGKIANVTCDVNLTGSVLLESNYSGNSYGSLTLEITDCKYTYKSGAKELDPSKGEYLEISVVLFAGAYEDLAGNGLDVSTSGYEMIKIRLDNESNSDNVKVCQYTGTVGCEENSEKKKYLYTTGDTLYIQVYFSQGYAVKGVNYDFINSYEGLSVFLADNELTRTSVYKGEAVTTTGFITNDFENDGYQIALIYSIIINDDIVGDNLKVTIQDVDSSLIELGGKIIEFNRSGYNLGESVVVNSSNPIVFNVVVNGYIDDNYMVKFGSVSEGAFYYSNSLYLEVVVYYSTWYVEADESFNLTNVMFVGANESGGNPSSKVNSRIACDESTNECKYELVLRYGKKTFANDSQMGISIGAGVIKENITEPGETDKRFNDEFNSKVNIHVDNEIDNMFANFSNDENKIINVFEDVNLKLEYVDTNGYYISNNTNVSQLSSMCSLVVVNNSSNCTVVEKDSSIMINVSEFSDTKLIKFKEGIRNKYGVPYVESRAIISIVTDNIIGNYNKGDSVNDRLYQDPIDKRVFHYYIEKSDFDNTLNYSLSVQLVNSNNLGDIFDKPISCDNEVECLYDNENNIMTIDARNNIHDSFISDGLKRTFNYVLSEDSIGYNKTISVIVYLYDSNDVIFDLTNISYSDGSTCVLGVDAISQSYCTLVDSVYNDEILTLQYTLKDDVNDKYGLKAFSNAIYSNNNDKIDAIDVNVGLSHNLLIRTSDIMSETNQVIDNDIVFTKEIIRGKIAGSFTDYETKVIFKIKFNSDKYRESLKVVVDFINKGMLSSVTGKDIKADFEDVTIYSYRDIIVPVLYEGDEQIVLEYVWHEEISGGNSFIVEPPKSEGTVDFIVLSLNNNKEIEEKKQINLPYSDNITITSKDVGLGYDGQTYKFSYLEESLDTTSPVITKIVGPYIVNKDYSIVMEKSNIVKYEGVIGYQFIIRDDRNYKMNFNFSENVFGTVYNYIDYVTNVVVSRERIDANLYEHVYNVYFMCSDNCQFIDKEIRAGLNVDKAKLAIFDNEGNVSTLGLIQDDTSSFGIVPCILNVTNSSNSGNVYFRNLSLLYSNVITYNNDIDENKTQLNIKINELSKSCVVENGKVACKNFNISALTMESSPYPVTITGTVTDIYGNELIYENEKIANIYIDEDRPVITKKTNEGLMTYYTGENQFKLEFNVSDNFDKVNLNLSKDIIASVFDGETKTATCTIVAKELKENILSITISGCTSAIVDSSYNGHVRVSFQEGVIIDEAGNNNIGEIFDFDNVRVSNDTDIFVSYNVSASAISVSGQQKTNIEFTFKDVISVIDASKFVLSNVDVGAKVESVVAVGNKVLVVVVAEDGKNGSFKLKMLSNAVRDNFGYYNEEIVVEESISVLNREYIVNFYLDNEGCRLTGDIYYCKEGTSIIVSGEVEEGRLLSGTTTLTYKIGNSSSSKTVNGVINDQEIIYTIEIIAQEAGLFQILNINLDNVKDQAGNSVRSTTIDKTYIVNAVGIQLDEKYKTDVFVGEIYDEVRLTSKISCEDNSYVIRRIYNDETLPEANLLDNKTNFLHLNSKDNQYYYSKSGIYFADVLVIDNAGNEAEIILQINVITDLEIIVNLKSNQWDYYGIPFVFNSDRFVANVSAKDNEVESKLNKLEISFATIKANITSATLVSNLAEFSEGVVDVGVYNILISDKLVVNGVDMIVDCDGGEYTVLNAVDDFKTVDLVFDEEISTKIVAISYIYNGANPVTTIKYKTPKTVDYIILEGVIEENIQVEHGYIFKLTNPILLEESTLINVQLIDSLGNKYESYPINVEIDLVAPRIQFELTTDKDVALPAINSKLMKYYTFNNIVKLVVSSDESDIASCKVKVNEQTVEMDCLEGNSLIINLDNGVNTISITMVDIAGNGIDAAKVLEVVYINPVLSNVIGDKWTNEYNVKLSNLYDGLDYKLTYSVGNVFTDTLDVYSTFVDIKGNVKQLGDLDGEYSFSVDLVVCGEDFTQDNKNVKTIVLENDLKLDTKVEFSEEPQIYDSNIWSNTSKVVVAKMAEDSTGIVSAYLKYYGSNEEAGNVSSCVINDQYDIECSISENNIYVLEVIDGAGNKIQSSGFVINKIDTTGIAINISAQKLSSTLEYAKSYLLNISYSYQTDYAGIKNAKYFVREELEDSVEVTIDNFNVLYQEGAYSYFGSHSSDVKDMIIKDITGVYRAYVLVEDAAGNITFNKSDEMKIDNSAPKVEIVMSNLDFENPHSYIPSNLAGSEVVKVIDNHSGLPIDNYRVVKLIDEEGKEVDLINLSNKLTNGYLTRGIVEGKYYILVTAEDKLGNKITVKSESVINIDNKGPNIVRLNVGKVNEIPVYKVEENVSDAWYCISSYQLSENDLSNCNKTTITEDNFDNFAINYDIYNATKYVTIRATDEYGNISTYVEKFVYDNQAPEISVNLKYQDENGNMQLVDNSYIKKSKKDNITRITTTKKVNTKYEVNIVVSDAVLENLCYYVETSSKSTIEQMNANACINSYTNKALSKGVVIDAGERYVNIFAIDAAGQISKTSVYISKENIDTVGVNPQIIYDNNKLSQEQNMIVTFENKLKKYVNKVMLYRADFGNSSFTSVEQILDSTVDVYGLCGVSGVATCSKFEDDQLTYKVVENGVYLLEVLDVYGNIRYAYVEVDNIDKIAPSLYSSIIVGSVTNPILVNSDSQGDYVHLSDLIYVTESKGESLLNLENGSSESIYNHGEYLYKNKFIITIASEAVADVLLGNRTQSTVSMCIYVENETSKVNCDNVFVLYKESNSNQAVYKSRKAIEVDIGDVGKKSITYYFVDEAGNKSESQILNIEKRTDVDISLDVEIKDKDGNDVSESNNNWNNKASVLIDLNSAHSSKKGLIKSIEYKLNSESEYIVLSTSDLGIEKKLSIDGLDGIYYIQYRITDKLGNSIQGIGPSIKIDTINPLIEKVNLNSFLIEEGANHKLKLEITNKEENNEWVNARVYYGIDSNDDGVYDVAYCSDWNAGCGTLDKDKGEVIDSQTQYTLFVQLIDRVGNLSEMAQIKVSNVVRHFELSTVYNIVNSKVDLVIKVYNSIEYVDRIIVKEGSLSDVVYGESENYTTTSFTHTLQSSTEQLKNGIEVSVEVFDNNQNTDEYGIPLTSMGVKTLLVKVNFENPVISFDNSNSTEITTSLAKENVFTVTPTKELKEAYYVLEKVGDNSTINSVDKFNRLYNSCWKVDKLCISGEIDIKTNTFVVKDVQGKLTSGGYRIVYLAIDTLGKSNYGVLVENNGIIVDVDAPVIKFKSNDETNVHQTTVNVVVNDPNSNVAGKLKYIRLVNLLPIVQVKVKSFEISSVSYTIEGDKIKVTSTNQYLDTIIDNDGIFEINNSYYMLNKETQMIHDVKYVSNAYGAESSSFNIGTETINQVVSEVKDGQYRVETEDLFGHRSCREITVYSDKDIYYIDINHGESQGIQALNVSTFKTVDLILRVKTQSVIIVFKDKVDNESIRIELDCKRGYIFRGERIVIKELPVSLESGIKINIYELLKYGNDGKDFEFNGDLEELYVEASSLSGITEKLTNPILLDFVNPEIKVVDNLEYLGERIGVVKEVNYLGVNCFDYNCYSLKFSVLNSSTSDDERINKLMGIVNTFNPIVDGNKIFNLQDTNIKERFKFKFNDNNEMHANDGGGGWKENSLILTTIGSNKIEFSYVDAAGNNSKPIYLMIDVVDENAPTFEDVKGFINKQYIQISNDKEAVYTDVYSAKKEEGLKYVPIIVGKDNYGFTQKGEVTTSIYTLEMKYNGYMLNLDENNLCYDSCTKFVGKKIKGKADSTEADRYVFNKPGVYEFKYILEDSEGNFAQKVAIVVVGDKKAPIITNPNPVEPNGTGENYYVLDINNSSICFDDNKTSCYKLLTAFDEEDGVIGEAKEVKLVSIEYKEQKNGVYNSSAEYSSTYSKDILSLFKLQTIEFSNVGYYRLKFVSHDSSINESVLFYEIKVEDRESPKFYVQDGEEKVAINKEEEILELEYSQSLVDDVIGFHGNENNKFKNYVVNWIVNNIDVRDNYDNTKLLDRNYVDNNTSIVAVVGEKEYIRVVASLSQSDKNGNEVKLQLIFSILDTIAPENGSIVLSYDKSNPNQEVGVGGVITNKDYLYFSLSGANDITQETNSAAVTYQYKIIIDGNEPGEWTKMAVREGEYVLAFDARAITQAKSIVVKYRSVDSKGNVSKEKSSALYTFDKIAPVVTFKDADGKVIETFDYSGGQTITVEIVDDIGVGNESIEVFKNNKKLALQTKINSFGHYVYKAKDYAGNEIIGEIIYLPVDNTYQLVDRDSLSNVGNAAVEQKTFVTVVIQKLSQDGKSLYYENISEIQSDDLITFMGVVPDKDGGVFSILNAPISGDVFKYNPSRFDLNAIENIKNPNPNYSKPSYLIRDNKGQLYVLIGIQREVEEEDSSQGGVANNTGEQKKSLTGVLFLIGGIGVLGGGFLILKLRKRVKAV